MQTFLIIILFFYAHDSAYYYSIPAYYSNLISQYAHEESIIKFNTIMNILIVPVITEVVFSLSRMVLAY